MQPLHILLLIGGYFSLLLAISYITNKGGSNADFFKAGKQSPWYLVAFGMIGASLSGVTFISVPGLLRQIVLLFSSCFGLYLWLCGYWACITAINYKLNLTSIYTYLKEDLEPRPTKQEPLSFYYLELQELVLDCIWLLLYCKTLSLMLWEYHFG